jgi:hypothetical protein
MAANRTGKRTHSARRTSSPSKFFALVAALSLLLTALQANATFPSPSSSSPEPASPKKSYKGKLPITELSEDEAILHALNRLAYGPRPSDVEIVRKMGLEKWIDQQLKPESIDDSALETRLAAYPTLNMSSKKLLDEFPPPQQAAKKEGVTKGVPAAVARKRSRGGCKHQKFRAESRR